MQGIEQRLRDLGMKLPELADVAGEYVHCKCSGNLLFLSGKGPVNEVGKVGEKYTTVQAAELARQVGSYLLAAMRLHSGSLDSIQGVVKVTGYINAVPGFT